jgi:hypothetical protein
MTFNEWWAMRRTSFNQREWKAGEQVARDAWNAAIGPEGKRLVDELCAVDSVLAGRDALDDKPDRISKILHAINTAKKVGPLMAEVELLKRKLG